MTTRAVRATVHGIVQGVGFRWYVSRAASELGLVGWVSNLSDGSVEVYAEGVASDVEALVEALREGPPGASVSTVSLLEQIPAGTLARFEIRAGAHRGD